MSKDQSKLKVCRIGKGYFTGTHRLTAIIDASWKVEESKTRDPYCPRAEEVDNAYVN